MRPKQVSVLTIVEAVQGPMALSSCFLDGSWCSSRAFCRLSPRLAPVQRGLVELLRNTTLYDLMEEPAPAVMAQIGRASCRERV